MRRLRIGWPAGALLAMAAGALAQSDDLKPFPAPDAGMQRVVIRVPAGPDPDDRKVEVMIGKTIEVDCNRHAFGTTVTRQVAQGWGFPYYVVGALTGPMSTQMACPPGFGNRPAFVRAHAEDLAWLRYNPRLPIVLYVPAGVDVRYRLWRAGNEMHDATSE